MSKKLPNRTFGKMKKLVSIATISIMMALVATSLVSVSLVSAAPGTFGNINIGGTAVEQAIDTLWACKFSLTERGYVSKLTAYLLGSSPQATVKAAIYDDDSNKPNNIVAIMSTEFTIAKTLEWHDLILDSPVMLDAGDYWLAVHHGDRVANLYYATGAADQWQSITVDYAGGPPASWGTSASWSAWEASIYATYTVPTWDSYSDSDRTVACDDFNDPSEQTVYMKGTGLGALEYKIAYYMDIDGADTQVEVDVGTGGELITSNCLITSYYGFSDTETWAAVVFYPATETAPDTYAAALTSDYYVIDDTFMVYVTIPEFPTIFAAIGVAGLCFGIYYWMRKRRLVYVKG